MTTGFSGAHGAAVVDFDARRIANATAKQKYENGGHTIAARLNLTALLAVKQRAASEKRAPTPEELDLAQDYTVTPIRPGGVS